MAEGPRLENYMKIKTKYFLAIILCGISGIARYSILQNKATEAPRTKIEASEAIKEPNQAVAKENLAKTGVASWYSYRINGINWSDNHRTAASRDFKRYSTVRVTNLDNGKSVEVYINDFGPEEGQVPERIIDLSSDAFAQIADLKIGLINVKIEII